MSIDSIGAYSPEKVYGQLTRPFKPDMVKINAHTPYDKEKTENTTPTNALYDTIGKKTNLKDEYKNIQDKVEVDTIGIKINKDESDETEKDKNNANIAAFSKSTLSKKDFVNNALKQGYSAQEAAVIDRAQKAYEKSATVGKDPIKALKEKTFKVR